MLFLRKTIIHILLILVLSYQLSAQNTANPNASQETKQILQYLDGLKNNTTNNLLLGQNLGHGGGMMPGWTLGYDAFVGELYNQTGKWVGLIGGDYGLDPNHNVANTNQLLTDYWNAGGLVTLSWHFDNPWTGGNSWDTNQGENLYDLITPGNAAYTNWQAQLQEVANALKPLRNAGVTVLWRPLHEMNGDWFWWGKKTTTNHEAAFIDLYRNMFDYLSNTEGLDNLLWVFSTANSYDQNLLNYYPGAGYVDITGIDIYEDNVNSYFPSRDYQDLQSLGHPMGLTEFGPTISTTNGTFDNRQLVSNIKSKYPDFVFSLTWHDWFDGNDRVEISIAANQFANETFADPCVITREEIDYTNSNSCDEWELVWQDEFDGTALSDTWYREQGNHGWGNNELQNYTDSPNNAFVQNGTLNIVAREPSPGSYTSARIISKDKAEWKYARVEASIKLPIGQGIWPAFWMMPTDSPYGLWPRSGEIDIMEYLGHQPNRAHTTCHFGNSSTNKGQLGNSYDLPSGNYPDNFHLFAIEWSENEILWFIDGVQVHSANNTEVAPFQWPFDSRFHLLLNVAVGGNWPGSPDNTTIFPQTMEVDYVRVYQKPQDFVIRGNTSLFPMNSGEVYSLPAIPGAQYSWTVPSCATFVSGQGTNQIVVDWLDGGGEIQAEMELDCGTYYLSLPIEVTNNLLINPGFEDDLSGYFLNFYNGAQASFYLTDPSPYAGNASFCADITQLGSDWWNAQLLPNPVAVMGGETYHLSFYAKADANNRQMTVSFRNTDGHVTLASFPVSLTDSWAFYDYYFTPTTNVAALSTDFNLGLETGTYCFDEVRFDRPGPVVADCQPCIDTDIRLWLEGAYDAAANQMTNQLYNNNLLPSLQPYSASPWNYNGQEGSGWSTGDYFAEVVDWVLVSVRSGVDPSTTVAKRAALLRKDGRLVFPGGCFTSDQLTNSSYYLLIEHRNHIGVLSPNPIPVNNGRLVYNFQNQDGYSVNASVSQKELLPGIWGLFAGDIDQSDFPSYDVNALDKTVWNLDNGLFNLYLPTDVNMDGDVNAADKLIWQYNSGVFSGVPK